MGKHDQLADFQRFGFDESEAFQAYLKTVDLLDNSALQRVRARWYKKNIDVNFDMAWLVDLSSTQAGTAAGAAGAGRASSFTPRGAAPTAPTGSNPSSAPPPPPQNAPPASSSSWATNLSQRTQSILLSYHAALIFLALIHLIPLFPAYSLSAYRLFLQLSIIGEGFKLVQLHGLPKGLRPFSWPTLQQYIAMVMPTSHLYFMVLGLSFANQRPQSLLTVPILIPAVYALFERLSRTAAQHALWQRYGVRANNFLQARKRESALMGAYAEIAVGFGLVAGLLGRYRNIMLTFLFWNLLKMRYHVGDAAANHRMVWQAIDQKTLGIRAQFPILNKVLGPITAWFMSVR